MASRGQLRSALGLFAMLVWLTACGGGGSSGGGGNPTGGGLDNPPGGPVPTANAGADIVASAGSAVTLDGSLSSHPDGASLTYAWRQTAGTPVTLSGASTATPSFTAPSAAVTLTFELTVTGGGRTSAPDTVNVAVTLLAYGAAGVIDTPGGRPRLERVDLARDPATGQAMALYIVNGRSTDTYAWSAPYHLYTTTSTPGSPWTAPQRIDDGSPDIVWGDIAWLGGGRYLAGWTERYGIWGVRVRARVYDPAAGGWGAIRTVVQINSLLDMQSPGLAHVVGDPSTGTGLLLWEDSIEGTRLVDYRGGTWGSPRGVLGSRVVDSACDGVRCVLLTTNSSGSVYAVRYDLASGSLGLDTLDTEVSNLDSPSLASTPDGFHAVWLRFVVPTGPYSLEYRRLPAGSNTWDAAGSPLYTPASGRAPDTADAAGSSSGEVTVVWTDRPVPPSGPPTLLTRTYTPGSGWSAEQTAATSAGWLDLQIAYVNASDVHVIWTDNAGITALGRVGGSWGSPALIDTPRPTTSGAIYYDVHLAGLPGIGEAMVVQNDFLDPQGSRTSGGAWPPDSQSLPMAGLDGGSGLVDVAGAPDGAAVAVWRQWDDRETVAVFASVKPAGGGWQPPLMLTAPDDHAYAARAVYAGAGRFAVIWRADRAGVVTHYARSWDATAGGGAGAWAASAAAAVGGGFEPMLAAAGDGAGTAVAAWYVVAGTGQTGHIGAGIFDAAANGWVSTTTISDALAGTWEIAAASDQAGGFMVVWKQSYLSTAVRARRYSAGAWQGTAADTLDTAVQFPERTLPALASAQAGEFMACWHGVAGTPGDQLRCARYAGGAWEAPADVDQTSSMSSEAMIGTPDLAADGAGAYALVWRRHATTGYVTRWLATRYAGGWQPEQVLFSKTSGIRSESPNIDPTVRRDAAGNLLVVWSDEVALAVPSGYAAYYDAAAGQWMAGQAFEASTGQVLSARPAAVPPDGFQLLWVQDEGSRFAVHARSVQ